jgi:predicted KAP-like P-loop ATPase
MDEILANQNFKDSRIVIFVDDLDRCSPEKTLEVFESIKVFLDIRGFIFILGLSREALDKLIVAKFEKMGLKEISGEDYIRKIIQVEIRIGKWENESIGNLINVISNELDDKYRIAVKNSRELINEVVESNPRQTKRFINNLIVALTANPDLNYNTFLCVEALQRKWKNFYNNLSNPRFLKEIKSGLTMSEEQRYKYVDNLKAEQKKGKLRSDLVDILTDLTICYTDKELWRFLAKFGEPILKDISPSEEPATDKELKVAKTLESYKKARDSTVHIAKRSVIIIYSNLLNYFNLCTFDGFSNCNSSLISSTEPELLLP